jgi:hypothetical protein
VNKFGRIVLGLIVAALVVVPAAALAAAPANDNFAGAQVLPADFGSVTGDNTEATSEDASGEPDHAGSGFGPAHSVWYQWRPAADSSNTFDTCGSSFDTRIAIYVGSDVGSLSPIDANNDSAGANCPGTKASEVTSFFSAGTDYYIAVDTMGPLPSCEPAHTRGAFRLRLNGSGDATQMPCPGTQPPPGTDGKSNPGQRIPPKTAQFTVPRLDPQGTNFFTLPKLHPFLRNLRDQGLTYHLDADPFPSKEAETGAQRKYLREQGGEAEILRGHMSLRSASGTSTGLAPGKEYNVVTTQATLRVEVDFFDLGSDLKAIADEKAELERQAKQNKDRAEARSKCLPIAAGSSAKQIKDEYFPTWKNPFYTYSDAIEVLSKLKCDVLIDKYVRGKPSAPHAYVKDVVKTDEKSNTVYIALAQPGSHDFVFTLRENPREFVSQATKANMPIGTDGRLTVSDKQLNRVTVQVIERATGRLVAGIPVTFIGKNGDYVSQLTDGNGETTFTPLVEAEDKFRLSAEYMEMEGWRTVRAIDRDKKAFTSMAGRRIVRSTKGIYAGNQDSELEFAKSLPVVPANLGSGDVGEVQSVPVVRQGTVITADSAGDQFTGQYNTIDVPNNSEMLVGAAPGVVAAGGGAAGQAARVAARAGISNPLDFLAAIVSPLTQAISEGAANIRSALDAAQQAWIAQTANLIGQAGGNVISDNGLGVISTGGGNLIGQAGGNLISDKGLGMISVGDAQLISENGLGLISDKGLGLVAAQGSQMSVHGGRVISTGGGN